MRYYISIQIDICILYNTNIYLHILFYYILYIIYLWLIYYVYYILYVIYWHNMLMYYIIYYIFVFSLYHSINMSMHLIQINYWCTFRDLYDILSGGKKGLKTNTETERQYINA